MALPQTRKATVEFAGEKGEIKDKYSTTGGGFGVFFDATYLEIGLGLDFATAKKGKSEETYGGETITIDPPDSSMGINYFSFSLLGKYPIALGSKATLSPMVGFDWNIATSIQSTDKGVKGTKYKRSDFATVLGDDYKNTYDGFFLYSIKSLQL
jgi:hypothetical protein